MKYIKNFNSHREIPKQTPVNEEFLFGLLGKLFNKIKERVNKTKGGKEVDAIYQKWMKVISDQIAKLGITDLNLFNQETDKAGEEPAIKDEAKAKALNDNLNKQKSKIEQIIVEAQKGAKIEMEGVLKKMGGASANPQLDMIIQSKLIQFKIDVLNAEVSALNKVGDSSGAANIQKLADDESKKIEIAMKDFDTAKAVTYKEGDEVIYLLKDRKKEEWDKLTPEEKAKPEEKPASDIVGVHKISKIEGDKFTIEDKNGNPTINKTGAEIVGKYGQSEGEKVEGQEDLIKKLGELKTKKPDDIKKVGSFVDFISDDANKDKVAEIDKIMGGEAGA